MTITIDLTPEQQAKLQSVANAKGTDAGSVLVDLLDALPNETNSVQKSEMPIPDEARQRRKTTAEILAGWDAAGLPSVYGRDQEDATVIARRLRKQAESRTPLT